MSDIETPCVKICVVDPQRGICTGCGRTVAEIGAWMAMTPQERQRVMSQLPERLRTASARRTFDS